MVNVLTTRHVIVGPAEGKKTPDSCCQALAASGATPKALTRSGIWQPPQDIRAVGAKRLVQYGHIAAGLQIEIGRRAGWAGDIDALAEIFRARCCHKLIFSAKADVTNLNSLAAALAGVSAVVFAASS